MSGRTTGVLVVAAAALLAVGCAEKPQAAGQPHASRAKADAKPWAGEPTPYSAGGFDKGDRTSWEKALHSRAQSQNEYVRSR
jgi:hypothetical protein